MTNKKPKFYALTYVTLIPIFATIYLILPKSNFGGTLATSMDSFMTCLYYSTVTITTLGYGDISALTNTAQLLVIFETILGVITIGLFLNSLSIKHSIEINRSEKEKELKEKFKSECDKIIRHNKIIEQNIKFYLTYVKEITTPFITDDNGDDNDATINYNFSINDMKDMFLPSSLMTDNFSDPVIKYFYKHQNILEQSIKKLLLDINFSYWSELEQKSIEFLNNSKTYDFSESILAIPSYNIGEEKASVFFSKSLEDFNGDLEFKKGNFYNQFIALHNLIKLNCEFITFYQTKISEIKNNCA
ncbi:potassium channel family protein [Flavobacterium gawalongense]|uniref:Two pore domain potassium channel family protein n=1 Tax=Flavobacterium gawalongense TaxID=2594432 RepID=A0A553BHF4_9FLAO|nr:potassium channel family protein [Flavobacterium gawalongense]TRX07675.1 two pore domain potassium channel family protein [Flavobacterium gawalongense]TRX07812.1 two pore domain potassium channel family protein [Flavobacterium gawalongense]TRX23595.1 two pore domain potassium channel family protein [Flavobacterium gawalongense]